MALLSPTAKLRANAASRLLLQHLGLAKHALLCCRRHLAQACSQQLNLELTGEEEISLEEHGADDLTHFREHD